MLIGWSTRHGLTDRGDDPVAARHEKPRGPDVAYVDPLGEPFLETRFALRAGRPPSAGRWTLAPRPYAGPGTTA